MVITELREQIATLQKQLAAKDQQLTAKDQQLLAKEKQVTQITFLSSLNCPVKSLLLRCVSLLAALKFFGSCH